MKTSLTSTTKMVSTMLILMAVLQTTVSAAFVQYCDLRGEKTQQLAFDPTSGAYKFMKEGQSSPQDRQRRRAVQEQQQRAWNQRLRGGSQSAIVLLNRDLQQEENINGTTTGWIPVQVRNCGCNPDVAKYYCPLPYTQCGIRPEEEGSIPGCVLNARKTKFIRFTWVCCLGVYLALFLYISCTHSGRSVVDYGMAKIFPSWWNQWVADRILRIDPQRGTYLITRYARMRRQQIEQRYLEIMATRTEGGINAPGVHVFGIGGALPQLDDNDDGNNEEKPTELHLKTKIYSSPNEDSRKKRTATEDEDDATCTICFVPVEEGERVASLPCEHTFHVSCLKSWLSRRNVCPLCTRPAAKPVYESKTSSLSCTASSNGNSSDSDNS